MPTAPSPQVPDKFSSEKFTFRGVTLLTLRGTLDHAFEGRKLAEEIHTKKLVVNMRDARRFASWGMSAWMDFLRINAQRDLYLVECSTYAVSQLNLVTGLLGHAKLVSFYASYRCGSCSEEREALFLIPRDRAEIRELPDSHQECATCGGRARLEEYPASFFEKIAERSAFDLDDEVLAFLRSHYKYDLVPDLTRFRAHRRVHKGYTYLRLSGSLATLPGELLAAASEGTTAVDLQGVVFDPAETSEWRTYVNAAMARGSSLQLLNCPPGFLESAVAPEDMRDKLKIRTFALPYDCLRCETTTPYMVDVAENLEQLVSGIAPAALCPACGSSLVAPLSPEQAELLHGLPARDRDPVLDKLLAAMRNEPSEKLENCLVALPPAATRAPAGARRAVYVALGLALVLIGGLAAVAVTLWQRGGAAPAVAPVVAAVPAQPPKPAVERPDWIITDLPSSAYCHDMINRLMCVGVSSYRPTRDEAVADANDAALEELVTAIGLKISEPFFRDAVVPAYSEVRAKALSALQAPDLDRASAAGVAADGVVSRARKRVVEVLHGSGGAAVPTQRSDWYWEEYAAKGGGTEVLVFVRYDVTLDAIKALVERYSTPAPVLGGAAITAFPGLAWPHEDFTGGAMLTKVARPLADAGLAARHVIMAVGDQRVGDVTGLARRIEDWKQQPTGELKLTVKAPEAAARVVELERRRVR